MKDTLPARRIDSATLASMRDSVAFSQLAGVSKVSITSQARLPLILSLKHVIANANSLPDTTMP